jgi:alkylated DNA nucleotide flippase Atl1
MKNWKEQYEKGNDKGSVRKETNKGMMYISTPKEISQIIKTIPKGSVMTTKEIAHILSEKHNAEFTCGLTTGIFVAILANYVEQEKIDDIPYWRVVKDKGVLYDSYLRQPSCQDIHLKKEGHVITKKGKKGILTVAI